MQWSSEVESIFTAIDRENRNILINACPGAGKTTVLTEIWNRSSDPMTFIAFNKAIVDTIKEKVKEESKGTIATLHSLGMRAIGASGMKVFVDRYKVSDLIKTHYRKAWSREQESVKRYEMARLVSCMKGLGEGTISRQTVKELAYQFDLNWYSGIEDIALDIFQRSLEDTSRVDFDDQLLFPVLFSLKLPESERNLIDEAQDLNAVQGKLVEMLSGQKIFMGDKRQSIYAFRGALADSMEVLSHSFECIEYPMTLTYRCPQAVVAEAQQLYPHDIRALDTAPLGLVKQGLFDDTNYSQGDLIVCRNNLPLINLAYALLRQNIPCQVRGRDIGQNLVKYLTGLQGRDVLDLMERVDLDIGHQIDIARQREDDDKIQSLQDKALTVRAFAENYKGKDCAGLYQSILSLFENGRGVMLSTIHKAKGLEAKRVYFLDSHLCYQQRKGMSATQKAQERNLAYVAITRASQALAYIKSGEKE